MRIRCALVATMIVLGASCQKHTSVRLPGMNEVAGEIRSMLGIPSNDHVLIGAFAPQIGTLFCTQVLDPNLPKPPDTCTLSDPSDWFTGAPVHSDHQTVLKGIYQERPVGKFQASGTLVRDVNISADLPLIGQIVAAGASVDVGKNSKVTITGNGITQRIIKWIPLREAAKANEFNDSTQKELLSGEYVIAVSDWVMTKFKAQIEVDPTLSVSAKASLANAIAQLAKNTAANVKVSNTGTGSFSVSADTITVASMIDHPDKTITQAAGPPDASAKTGLPVNETVVRSLVQKSLENKGMF